MPRLVALLFVAAGFVFGAAGPASATTSTSVVYTATTTIPAPPSSTFAGAAGGGDGWAVALTPTAVYNVFHHATALKVNCHLQADASPCWSTYKTITDSTSGNQNFATSGQPGMWVDQATGYLYVFATRADGTGGVVCIDTTQPATVANPFCGFTALTPIGTASTSSYSAITDPVMAGNNWYAFNEVNTSSAPTGTQDQLLCFNTTTLSACANQPYAVNLGASNISSGLPSPSIALINSTIFIPFAGTVGGSSGDYITCFDPSTNAACSGSWPTPVSSLVGGAPFPLLSSTGAPSGLCLAVAGDPCYDFNGSLVSTPVGLTSVITQTDVWNGPAVVLGTRIYVPNGNNTNPAVTSGDGSVECFDYSTGAVCAGYSGGMSFNNLGYLYTVNVDPQRPTCLWVNADYGSAQIQNFDAYTGGSCAAAPLRVVSSSIVASSPLCLPSTWQSLQVLLPAPSGYTSGTVSFDDQNGNPIPGIAPQPLDATGSVNLSTLAFASQSDLPQFILTLNGAASGTQSVQVKLTWTGQYSASCLNGSVTTASAVPGNGYRVVGADGGVFAFGGSAFYGSVPGLGVTLNKPIVGMAATSDGKGYWLVASDGGIFSFGDASFYGSMGNVTLNKPIVGMAATSDGKGYWLVASDGGIFTFGNATFYGSMGSITINQPVVGMAATSDGKGYWLVASDGGIFSFGDANFDGSLPAIGIALNAPITGMSST